MGAGIELHMENNSDRDGDTHGDKARSKGMSDTRRP